MTPGKGESRLGVKVHTSTECKTDISVVLMVTSGLMCKLDSHDTWRWNLLSLLPRALAEWLFRADTIAILCT